MILLCLFFLAFVGAVKKTSLFLMHAQRLKKSKGKEKLKRSRGGAEAPPRHLFKLFLFLWFFLLHAQRQKQTKVFLLHAQRLKKTKGKETS